jgi:hypothetical protein
MWPAIKEAASVVSADELSTDAETERSPIGAILPIRRSRIDADNARPKPVQTCRQFGALHL